MKSPIIELEEIVATIRNGANLPQYDQQSDGMLPISRIETIANGTIDWRRVKYSHPSTSETFIENGDVLFSHINSVEHIGKTAIFLSQKKMIHGINLLLLKVDRSVCDPRYLYFYLNFPPVRTHFRTRCKRAVNQASLNQSDILSLRIPLPSLQVQSEIITQLERANELRITRRNALRLCDDFLSATFLKMFRGELNRGPFINLGDLVTITGGGTPSRSCPDFFLGNIPWLTAKDMRGDYIWDTEEHVTPEAIENSATKLVPAGSILVVVKSKILMRRLPLAISKVPLCHGQDIKSIQCGDGLLSEFSRYLLKYYEARLLNLARGANTEGLTLPMLEELPVPEVALEKQLSFESIAKHHERLRATHVEALRQAEHLFQSLLHRAFNGEV